jgi:hypothetical protein
LISANRISVEWKEEGEEGEEEEEKREKGVSVSCEGTRAGGKRHAGAGSSRADSWEKNQTVRANGTKEEKHKANWMNTGKWTNREREREKDQRETWPRKTTDVWPTVWLFSPLSNR